MDVLATTAILAAVFLAGAICGAAAMAVLIVPDDDDLWATDDD